MNPNIKVTILTILFISENIYTQQTDPFSPDFKSPEEIQGLKLIWNDEFNNHGKPSKSRFPIGYEIDYVRVYQKK